MQGSRQSGWRRGALVIVAGLALANGGCLLVAAGAAAGGAAGYAYYKGKVCRSYNASFDDVWAAAQTALPELGMKVESQARQDSDGAMYTRLADGSKVRIDFDTEKAKIPVEGALTRVCIRIGTFGDQDVSHRILNQIDAHLAHPATLMGPPAPAAVQAPPTWKAPAAPPETAPPPLLEPPVSPGGVK